MVLLALACTADGTGPGTDTELPDGPTWGTDLVATDANVNTFTSDWVLPLTPVPAATDVFVRWPDVKADAYGVVRAPDAYDTVTLLHANAPRGDLEDALELGRPHEVATESWSAPAAGDSTVQLSDLAGFDPALLVEDAAQSWLFTLQTADGGLRTGLWLDPKVDQSGTNVTIPAVGPRVDFTSRFDGETLRTDGGVGTYTFDFAGVTIDGYGQPLDPANVDLLFIGAYEGPDEADDLAGDIYDLQSPSDGWWTLSVDGQTAVSSADFVGTDGAFPGFTADRVWLVGAQCGSCGLPVPAWVVTVLVE